MLDPNTIGPVCAVPLINIKNKASLDYKVIPNPYTHKTKIHIEQQRLSIDNEILDKVSCSKNAACIKRAKNQIKLQGNYTTDCRTLPKLSKNSTFVSAKVQVELMSAYKPNSIAEMHSSTGIVSTYIVDYAVRQPNPMKLYFAEVLESERNTLIAALLLRLDSHRLEYSVRYSADYISIETVGIKIKVFVDNAKVPRKVDFVFWDPYWDINFNSYIDGTIFGEFNARGHLLKSPRYFTFIKNNHVAPTYTHNIDGDVLHILNLKTVRGFVDRNGDTYRVKRYLVPCDDDSPSFRFAGDKWKRRPLITEKKKEVIGMSNIILDNTGTFHYITGLPTKEDFKTTHIFRSRKKFIASVHKIPYYPDLNCSKEYIDFLGLTFGDPIAPKSCAHPKMAWLADTSPFIFASSLPCDKVNLLLMYPGKRDTDAFIKFNKLCDMHNQQHLKFNVTLWQPDVAARDITFEGCEKEPKGRFDAVVLNEVYHGIGKDSNVNLNRAFSKSELLYIVGYREQNKFAGTVALQPYIKQKKIIHSFVGADEAYTTPESTPFCVPGIHRLANKKILSSRQLASDVFPNFYNIKLQVVKDITHIQKPVKVVKQEGVEAVWLFGRLYLLDSQSVARYRLKCMKKQWSAPYAQQLNKKIMNDLETANPLLYKLSVHLNDEGYFNDSIMNLSLLNRVTNDTVEFLLISSKTQKQVGKFMNTCNQVTYEANALKEVVKDPFVDKVPHFMINPEDVGIWLIYLAVILNLPVNFTLYFTLILIGSVSLPILMIIRKIKFKRFVTKNRARDIRIQFFDWSLVEW